MVLLRVKTSTGRWLTATCLGKDPMFFAVIDRALRKATGVASYLRIQPENGSIEVGHINFSPLLQRSRAATEAMYLMMKHAFDLGYRRYEWKCDALNAPSRAAAQRLGLSYRGDLPSGHGLQESQPRYCVVCDYGRGVASATRRVRALAGRWELRGRRAPTDQAERPHAAAACESGIDFAFLTAVIANQAIAENTRGGRAGANGPRRRLPRLRR